MREIHLIQVLVLIEAGVNEAFLTGLRIGLFAFLWKQYIWPYAEKKRPRNSDLTTVSRQNMANTKTVPQSRTTDSSLADPPLPVPDAAAQIQTAIDYTHTSALPPVRRP